MGGVKEAISVVLYGGKTRENGAGEFVVDHVSEPNHGSDQQDLRTGPDVALASCWLCALGP